MDFFFQNGDARQASLSKLHGFFPKIVIILLITVNYHQLNLNKNQMFCLVSIFFFSSSLFCRLLPFPTPYFFAYRAIYCLVSMVSGQQFSHFGQHLVWSAVSSSAGKSQHFSQTRHIIISQSNFKFYFAVWSP